MLACHIYEAVDRTLQGSTRVNTPLGGRLIVLEGDFRQRSPGLAGQPGRRPGRGDGGVHEQSFLLAAHPEIAADAGHACAHVGAAGCRRLKLAHLCSIPGAQW